MVVINLHTQCITSTGACVSKLIFNHNYLCGIFLRFGANQEALGLMSLSLWAIYNLLS